MKGRFLLIESSLVFFSLLFLTPQNMFRVSSLAAKSNAAGVRRNHFCKDHTAEQSKIKKWEKDQLIVDVAN